MSLEKILVFKIVNQFETKERYCCNNENICERNYGKTVQN